MVHQRQSGVIELMKIKSSRRFVTQLKPFWHSSRQMTMRLTGSSKVTIPHSVLSSTACESRDPQLNEFFAKVLYANNISLGSKNASTFELLYSRRPRHPSAYDNEAGDSTDVHDHAADVEKRLIKKMLRAPIYNQDIINICDTVSIWRDASGCLAPAALLRYCRINFKSYKMVVSKLQAST